MSLESALQSFSTQPLLKACRSLFKDTLNIPLSPLADSPINPERFFRDNLKEDKHRTIRHLYLVGRIDDRCFQYAQAATVDALDLDATLATTPKDYDGMFVIAVEMAEGEFTRSDLAARTREINRVFTNPVIVVFKHLQQKQPVLSIGVISRREHKRTQGAHVLGKVSMIREIRPQTPHRGHIEILKDFSLTELEKNAGNGKRGHKIDSFKSFHAALEAVFDTDLLNARFYKDLANWYFWALPQVEFPDDMEKDDEKRRATGLIRLLTRLIFCWFLKEKDGLIPEKLFDSAELQKILKGFEPESETSSAYYQAILQNLFFATLNQRMDKDSNGKPYRIFATDEGFQKNRATYDVNNLYRYEKLFAVPEKEALALFADIPFLNGGLFECLDRTEDETNKKLYLDGFSRRKDKRPHLPDRLFFDSGETADLSEVYGDKKRKAEKVTGLITILNRYKFTIVENTPIDQEIALDPELLGKVFENLLASYNEETKTTARKQTGSFYTPRPIVDYMVDESLKAHFERKLEEWGEHASSRVVSGALAGNLSASTQDSASGEKSASTVTPAMSSARAPKTAREARALPIRERLDLLFTYTEKEHAFTPAEVATLIAAIDEMKILDPACGSGAFPMGVLHKLVYILGKLDPDNDRWKQTQLAKLDSAPMREELERAFADNNDDYGRKLYLIENCLYGVDIQPIAIQITKLRFFISLVCDQKTNRNKAKNHGIRPLPNLETKFVAANTLIGLPEMEHDSLIDPRIGLIEKEIESLYHSHFSTQRRDQKLTLQRRIKTLRKEIATILAESLMSPAKGKRIAEWDPFDPQSRADFFDPHWMFGISVAQGFDITIGNPPYVRADEQSESNIAQRQAILASKQYETLWEKWDLFVPFLERSYKLLRADGISTMIVSDAFCHSKYAQKAQNWFLQNSRILRLDFCGEVKIFDAAVHNVITCFQKAEGANSKPLRRLHRESFGEVTELPTVEQAKLTHRVFFPEDNNLGQKFVVQTVPLNQACYVSYGLRPNSDEGESKGEFTTADVVSNTRDEIHSKPYVEGKHLGPWLPLTNLWIEWGTKRAPSRFCRPTFPELYKVEEKILAQRSPGPDPVIAYDNGKLVFTPASVGFVPWHSLHGVRNNSLKKAARYRGEKPPRPDLPMREELEATSRRFDVKYLLGVMNSGSARDFLRSNRRSNIHLYPDDWKKLPIPDVSAAQQKPIVALVDQILTLKRANRTTDISALETQLDAAVAKLYGLTPEEIAIVEGTAP